MEVAGSGYILANTGVISQNFLIMPDTQTLSLLPFASLSFQNWGNGDFLLLQTAFGQGDIILNPCGFFGCGKVGIGLTNPSERLHVNGNVRANSFILNSDENLKENVVTLTSALAKIEALNGVYFTWKQNEEETGVSIPEVNKQTILGGLTPSSVRVFPEGMQI